MILIKDISKVELGPRQMTFGFDDRIQQNMDRVYQEIESAIQSNGAVTLHDLLSSGSLLADISEAVILQSAFWLSGEKKIFFRCNGSGHSPHRTKQLLLENSRTIITIALNKKVDEKIFAAVQKMCRPILSEDAAQDDQYEFSRSLLTQLKQWRAELEVFQVKAERPGFPGRREIKNSLNFLEQLLKKQDPYTVIHTCLKFGHRMEKLAEDQSILRLFYKKKAQFWENLVDGMSAFKTNAAEIEKEKNVYEHYCRLKEIVSKPQPYSYVDEAQSAFEVVRACHEKIELRKLELLRRDTIAGTEKFIQKLIGLFDAFECDPEYRNETLLMLRGIKKKVASSMDVRQIKALFNDAKDLFVEIVEDM
jgi:hypothetical protein